MSVTIPLLMMTLASATPAPHPFSVHDLIAMERLSEPSVSPDGTRVVFTISRLDLGANRRRTDLWLTGTDGQGLRQLTTHEASDTSGAWSPDGRTIYFLSTRSGSSQVWRIAADGGEAEVVTRLPLDVGAFVLSPDGSRLAVALDVFPDCDTLACTQERLQQTEARKASGRIYDHLFVRHWDTWADGRRTHIVVVPLGGGEPVDVMKGMDADCPSKPFGDQSEVAFTPDSHGIVFSARDVERAEAWSTDFDLFLAPVDGPAKPTKLTTRNRAWDTGPVFSPDGRTLAYRAMSTPAYEADRWQIVLRDWATGTERRLATDWDRSPDTLVFSADGRTLYAIADDLGHSSLFAIDTTSGVVRLVLRNGKLRSPNPTGDRIVFGREHLRSPLELCSIRPDGTDLKQLTHVNDGHVAATIMGEPEQMTFKGWNDETVHAWIVKPAGWEAGKKYPVAFLIHGGPQGSFGNDFHYRWNPQTYAGAGYAAIMVDFHGPTGYGQAFCDSIQDDWGGKPLVDLQRGLAAALARYPWMDGTRVAALGASYGAYMVNWIAGQWPDRFRCLVSHDGNLDERMAYYDTEELWFPEREHRGTPWNNPAGYNRQNPIEHVGKWKTPMLVVHGGRDYRIVESQGLSTFTALQRQGIPSRLLYFPDENHWVLKPHNSILWHETVLAWLDQWAKPAAKP